MSDRRETMKAFLAAFNAHDPDLVMSFFADDCVFETPRGTEPWGTRLEGREAVRTGIAGRFQGIPDVHYGEDRHWSCGDRGASEWRLTGTTTDGVNIDVRGCDLFEFDGDKIVRKDSYWKIRE
jgi:ketosteroid isomerase-like protein